MRSYSKLQNGSDIRGTAVSLIEGEAVDLTEQAAWDLTLGFAVLCGIAAVFWLVCLAWGIRLERNR